MAGMVGQKYNNGSVMPVKIPYGICPTPADTQAKLATVKGVTALENGLSVRVKFTYAQGYDGVPSLNVNSLGAKEIKLDAATSAGKDAWAAGAVVDFYYDGTNWVQTSGGGNGGDAKTVNGHTVESDVPANAVFTDTTYESKPASSGGTDLSLVMTGEKAAWNAKTSNTGTVTKVSTGAGLTGGDITESGTVKANLTSETKLSNAAADGTETAGRVYPVRLDNNGKLAVNVPWTDNNTDTKNTAGATDSSQKLYLIGAESQDANPQTYSHDTAYVGTDGALYSEGKKVKTVQIAKSSPSASGNEVAFIDTIEQDAQGVITATKKNVRTFGGATASAAGSTGLVPAPAKGTQKKFLCADGSWNDPDGGKLVTFELDTVTNSGGTYTHTTTLTNVTHDMKAVLIETDNPEAFGATVHVTTVDGAITLTCDEVNGTAEVTVSCMFLANADPLTSSEFDVLSNRIGSLSALTTTDKSSVVGAINELNSNLAPLPDYSRQLHNSIDDYTATEKAWFMVLALNSSSMNIPTVNGIQVGIQDKSSGIYAVFATGWLNPGDVLSGSGIKRVFAVKS